MAGAVPSETPEELTGFINGRYLAPNQNPVKNCFPIERFDMKKIISSTIILVSLLGCSGSREVAKKNPKSTLPLRTLAVLNFETAKENKNYSWLKKSLADMLTTEVSMSQEYQVVLRHRLAEIMAEQKLQASGITDQATAVKIGHIANANIIVLGNYVILGTSIRIDANLVDTESASILNSASVSGEIKDLLKLERDLAEKMYKILGIKTALPDKGHYPTLATNSVEAIEYNYKGEDLMEQNNPDEAAAYFLKATIIDPGYKIAVTNYSGSALRVANVGETIKNQAKRKKQLKDVMGMLFQQYKNRAVEAAIIPKIDTFLNDPSNVKVTLDVKVKPSSYIISVLGEISSQLGGRGESQCQSHGMLDGCVEEIKNAFKLTDDLEINQHFSDLVGGLGAYIVFRDSGRKMLFKKKAADAMVKYNRHAEFMLPVYPNNPDSTVAILNGGKPYDLVCFNESGFDYNLEFSFPSQQAQKIEYIEMVLE